MKYCIAMFLVLLPWVVCSAQPEPACDVKFAPEAVKPKTLDSIRIVIASFIPAGESKRLSDLRLIVIELKNKKTDLADTLKIVLDANSLQEWQKAKLQQIPDLQT